MKKTVLRHSKKVRRSLDDVFRIGSIQSIIIISFTAVILLAMILVGIALYSIFSENAENNQAVNTQQIMDQTAINLEIYLNSMTDISDTINSSIKQSGKADVQELSSLFTLALKIRQDIVAMAVYDETGETVLITPQYGYDKNFEAHEQYWFQNAIDAPETFLFQPPHVQRIFEDMRPWVVSLCRGVTVYKDGRQSTLVTMVDMNFSVIEQLCSEVSLGKRGYVYIIDEHGNIIYHPQQQLIYAGLKRENIQSALDYGEGSFIDDFDGEKRITTVKNVKYTGWKMVGVSFVDELVQTRKNFYNFIIYILLFGIVFMISASIFISAKISQPIKRLEHQMNRIENGDFNINDLEAKGEDEVKRLTKAFNLMIARIKQLMEENINEQEEKRKSELKALQAQINPHFLYNTLDSIIWMNENKNHDGVTEMVAALARFFRISISKGNEIISVQDEIEHARSYLVIQKIRYKNKFEYNIEVEEEAYKYKTLKLILQPIIENAIYHGINKIQEKGEIKISAHVQEGILHFKVEDNGYGIEPEHLKEILDKEPTNAHTSGVGLKNVNERIKLCYGSGYGIKIESETEVGTVVNLIIPLQRLEEDESYEDNP